MRELTAQELDTQLAEQLPARELMGCWRPSNKAPSQTATGGNGGYNTPILSPQVNVGIAVLGTNNQVNNQSADGGDAANFG
jgi:hypothetical protein